jgi:hypothetical protein
MRARQCDEQGEFRGLGATAGRHNGKRPPGTSVLEREACHKLIAWKQRRVKAARNDFLKASQTTEGSVGGLNERLDKEGARQDGRARVVSREQSLVVEDQPRLESSTDDGRHLPPGNEGRWTHADTMMALWVPALVTW